MSDPMEESVWIGADGLPMESEVERHRIRRGSLGLVKTGNGWLGID